ncbi:MAG: cation transporter [Chloroflexi bacterium]|nr:cation transporter [Chloroflexota bacterium]
MAKSRTSIFAAMIVGAVALLATGCGRASAPAVEADAYSNADGALAVVSLEIPTVSCSTCWPRIEANAMSVPGVKQVKPHLDKFQTAVVVFDPGQTTVQNIVRAIEKGGDKVTDVIKVGE